MTMRTHTTIALLLAFMALGLHAQAPTPPKPKSNFQKSMEIAKEYEIKPMAKPDWADRDAPPLFTAAWYSDLHITSPESENIVRHALNAARDTLKPDFAFITGDNSAIYRELSAEEMGRPEGERRHLWLKRFLDKELARPFCIIPGDNWPWGFDKVFGSFHYSFDFGGYHFLFSAVDRQAKKDGCAVFDEATWRWMDEDLKANSAKPTLFIMHETIWPPTFLEAGKTEALLNANPQCLAALCGHLHLDLDLTHGSLRQLVAPAIGRSHRPAFKLLRFYKEAIVIDSYEWDAGSQAFCQAQKWQKIDVPEGLQAGLIPGKCAFENKSDRPATPRELDNALKERAGELNNSLFGFILSFGLRQIFGK